MPTEYKTDQPIDDGTYGEVYLAWHVERPHVFLALKKQKHPGEIIHELLREISIMGRLRHPSIVRLVDAYPRREHRVAGQGQRVGAFIVMEYCPMDFRKFQRSLCCCAEAPFRVLQQHPLPLQHVRQIVRDVLEGIAKMHSMGIMHRDLKPENILVFPFGLGNDALDAPERAMLNPATHKPLSAEGSGLLVHKKFCSNQSCCHAQRLTSPLPMDVVAQAAIATSVAYNVDNLPLRPRAKIGDFGSARIVGANYECAIPTEGHGLRREEFRKWGRFHSAGHTTCSYRSPEQLLLGSYSEAADLWSMGCFVFELASGSPLFQGRQAMGADWFYIVEHFAALGRPSPEAWRNSAQESVYPESFRAAVPTLMGEEGFLRTEPYKGKLIDALTKDGYELMMGLLCFDQYRRLSASAALRSPFFDGTLPPGCCGDYSR